jgi:NAD(P)-dependent dehydrogenase (short-subunit alcohol dehydrogenase family)
MVKGDPFDDLQADNNFVGIFVHGRAKLLTLLWSMGLSRQIPADQLVVTAVNPGMAWTSMTQSLSPEVVPAWRHIMPVVRFFQRRADPEHAAAHCERLVLAQSASVEGRYFDGAKAKNLPRKYADPNLPERVEAIGTELRAAAFTRGRLA